MTIHSNTITLSGAKGVPMYVTATDPVRGTAPVPSDPAFREVMLRAAAAVQSAGYALPPVRISFATEPSGGRPSGTGHDLAVALALIAATDRDGKLARDLADWLVLGELGLDGSVRYAPGSIQAVEQARKNALRGVIVPAVAAEAVKVTFGPETPVYGVSSLTQAVDVLSGRGGIPTVFEQAFPEPRPNEGIWDRIKGCENCKRALEIAAAGGHHVLLVGAPGTEKGLLARALTEILPPMTGDEALSVAKVHSACGLDGTSPAIGRVRPFRSPHHSASLAALLGGGSGGDIRPGEVSLATEGVLCIDEFAEAPKSVKEALRGPLEDRRVTISRLTSKVTLPARFQFVATSLPCPCGYYGTGDRCTCTTSSRIDYICRIDGPVYDRIDVQQWVSRPVVLAEDGKGDGTTREQAAARVAAAREMQRRRFGDGRLNADMDARSVDSHCILGNEEMELIGKLFSRLDLSVRSYDRILKVARTIADLAGRETISTGDIVEAAGYRFLDRRSYAPGGEDAPEPES